MEVEADIDAGSPGGEHTLLDTLKRYSEEVSTTKKGQHWEQIRINLFVRTMSFIQKPIDSITPDMIANWRDQRLESIAGESIRRELSLLSSVFEMARSEWRLIRENPVRDVRRPPKGQSRDNLISDYQIEQLMADVGYSRGTPPKTQQQFVMAALDLALETAMRSGEMLSLSGEDIHIDKRYVQLQKSKNGYRRKVPLSNEAVEILNSLDLDKPFPITDGDRDTLFRRVRDRLGMRGEFDFHDSRATAITRLAKKLDIHDLARLTGHRDLNKLMVYYRTTATEIASQLDE